MEPFFIIIEQMRNFLPEDLTITSWAQIQIYFEDLKQTHNFYLESVHYSHNIGV